MSEFSAFKHERNLPKLQNWVKMKGIHLRSLTFGKSALQSWRGMLFLNVLASKPRSCFPSRGMHIKQAIRPAILPTGLPGKTMCWKILRKQLKLNFLTGDNVTLDPADMIKSDEIVPLKASFDEVDYKVVRKGVNNLYHHRVSLLLQRVRYLSTINITKREKYLSIKSNPPALIISWGGKEQTGYLRGVIKDETKTLSILYPMFFQNHYLKWTQENRSKIIGEELNIDLGKVLKLAFSIPCFMLNRNLAEASGHEFLFVHKFLLPQTYSLDDFTAKMHPPIFNAKEVGRTYRDLINGADAADSFKFTLSNVLNMTYPSSYGKFNMEDLTGFIKEARADENYPLRAKGFNKKIEHYW